MANKKSKSAVSLDGVSDPKLIRNLQTDGLKHLVEQRLERASNYYTVITLMVFGCLFFGTACMQMNAATAFAVEDPVLRAHLGDLDARRGLVVLEEAADGPAARGERRVEHVDVLLLALAHLLVAAADLHGAALVVRAVGAGDELAELLLVGEPGLEVVLLDGGVVELAADDVDDVVGEAERLHVLLGEVLDRKSVV